MCVAKSDWITGLTSPKAIKRWFFSHSPSFLVMSSKTEDVHKEITKLQRKIAEKKAEELLATNTRQKEIKKGKIRDWEKEIEKLAESLPGLWEGKKKKRKAYIEDPDSD